MSKTPQYDDVESSSSHPDLLPPPSYTEATGSTPGPSRGSTTTSFLPSPGPGSGPAPTPISIRTGSNSESPLTTHLRTLPSRLRSAQHSYSTTQSTRETFLVSQCVPHIEWFIEDIVNLPKTPRVAELVLVPTEGLPTNDSSGSRYETSAGRELARKRAGREDKGWEMAGAEDRRGEGEVVKVVCVSALPDQVAVVDEKGRPVPVSAVDEKGRPAVDRMMDSDSGSTRSVGDYAFGEWGRFETEPSSSSSSSLSKQLQLQLGPSETWNWFTTPVLARRIASLLRPEPTLARRTVQAAVETPKTPTSPSTNKKSGFGSFFRRSSKSGSQTPPPMERVITPVRDGAMLEEDRIAMTVRAEEVTFRRANEFGVWESLSGWAVVVSIKVGRL